MKLKYYLRGLGTGILFATIILFISYSYKMSDSQIKKRAAELGMKYPDKETTQEETTKSNKETNVANKESGETSNEGNSEENSESGSEENTTGEVETEENTTKEPETEKTTIKEPETEEQTTKEPATEEETTKNNKPAKSYVLTVTSRTISRDVARKLESAGIIDDSEEFNDYLCDNGYASNIQNGKFTITSDMSYKEIAETITSKPKED